MQHDISDIFNRFAQREVEMTEETKIIKIGGKQKPYSRVAIKNTADPLLQDMRDAASAAGFSSLRIHHPGSVATRDIKMNRANARIEKHADGKWRISPHFYRG